MSSENYAVIDFMEHFWFHAFGIHMQVDACQAGVSDTVEVINEFFALVELGHVAQAASYLIAKYKYIKQGFDSCSNVAPVFNQGINELLRISSISDFTKSTFKAFEENMFQFSKNSIEFSIYLVIKDWPKIGDTTGELTKMILEQL